MISVLVDHDIEGHASLMWARIAAEGWPELLSLRMVFFTDVGLSISSNDRDVWRFAQQHDMILLTGNRRMREQDSLEATIRAENAPGATPVLTISKVSRLMERDYRRQCENKLLEIVLYLDIHRGAGRIFIP